MKKLIVVLKIIATMVMGLIGVGASLEMFENSRLLFMSIVIIFIVVIVSSTIVVIKDFEDVKKPLEILCENDESIGCHEYIKAVCVIQKAPVKYIQEIKENGKLDKKVLKLNYTTAQKILKKFDVVESGIYSMLLFPIAKFIGEKISENENVAEYIKNNIYFSDALIYICLELIVIGILIYIIYNLFTFKALKMNEYIENYLLEDNVQQNQPSHQSQDGEVLDDVD